MSSGVSVCVVRLCTVRSVFVRVGGAGLKKGGSVCVVSFRLGADVILVSSLTSMGL